MKYLFLDTNVYLHYKDFQTEIDWKNIFSDDITIVVPPVILEEINKVKDRETNSRKKKRAKLITSKMEDFLLNDTVGVYPVITCGDPHKEIYSELELDKDVQDNKLIASAINYSRKEQADVTIVSADFSILIKCKRCGVGYYLIENKYKLSEGKSEEEKEIENLKKELSEFKNRMPILSLIFENGTNCLEIDIPAEIDINEKVDELLNREYENLNIVSENGDILESFKHVGIVSKDDISKYTEDLSTYLCEYKKFTKYLILSDEISKFVRKINIYLANGGSCQSGNCFITIYFPDNVTIFNDEFIEKCALKMPIPPRFKKNYAYRSEYKPNGKFEKNIDRNYNQEIYKEFTKFNSYEFSNTQNSVIEKYNSHSVLHKVKLGIDIETYLFAKHCNSFTINYTIIEEHYKNGIEGELHVKINRSSIYG